MTTEHEALVRLRKFIRGIPAYPNVADGNLVVDVAYLLGLVDGRSYTPADEHSDPTTLGIVSSTQAIADEIASARTAAHRKHGADSIEAISADDSRWLSILVEEVGEVAHELTYDATGSLRKELLDTASVATAWIAALDAGR